MVNIVLTNVQYVNNLCGVENINCSSKKIRPLAVEDRDIASDEVTIDDRDADKRIGPIWHIGSR